MPAPVLLHSRRGRPAGHSGVIPAWTPDAKLARSPNIVTGKVQGGSPWRACRPARMRHFRRSAAVAVDVSSSRRFTAAGVSALAKLRAGVFR